ncbi:MULTISPECIES: hypothetical protein [Paenibacillus]|uniref:Uncharacterized protein n=1 Tax=Paenibacillus albilobatus TaxID=2716884 RepID=A0A919XJ28_9BACL|nr:MULTISPECIES: hypothetical protein [Paenibacillus]GIO31785.1 hypothetical protein J2TS6_29260 [Paenibacillus albilobatus]
MLKEISNLLNNSKQLAQIWANVNLKEINFSKIVIPDEDQPRGDGIESLTIISCRNKFTSYEAAFVTLLKKMIYDSEEWHEEQYNDGPEIWEELLDRIWIPEYIKKESFKTCDPTNFLNNLSVDLHRLNIPQSVMEDLFENMNDLKVIEFNNGLLCLDIFGLSDDICFFYSWWIGY